jgi:hypothetical protein
MSVFVISSGKYNAVSMGALTKFTFKEVDSDLPDVFQIVKFPSPSSLHPSTSSITQDARYQAQEPGQRTLRSIEAKAENS